MRSVSFVDRLEFPISEKVCRSGVSLGDVDGDGDNELIVGTMCGTLMVFKGDGRHPWFQSSVSGMIVATIVGDICNTGHNYLVVLTVEGLCVIYCMKDRKPGDKDPPFHSQILPANVKQLLLTDADNDGAVELVMVLTDRVLRTYRWLPDDFTATAVPPKGKLIGLGKWEFASQIGNATTFTEEDGSRRLLIVHPGGALVKINSAHKEDSSGELGNMESPINFLPLSSNRMRNPNISAEVIGDLKIKEKKSTDPSPIAIATLDGTLKLICGDTPLWSLHVDHQLFALSKMDVVGDGYDEVVACAWNGLTYFVDSQQRSVRFHFDESVSTFTTGHYAVRPGESLPCLIYGTFTGKLYLYYNLRISPLVTENLLVKLQNDPEWDQYLKSQSGSTSDVISKLLYENHRE